MGASAPDIDPEALITRHYPCGNPVRELLLRHGELVARKAIDILHRADWLDADRDFTVQAAFLHDIGIGRTHCPELGCRGVLPYVCHGFEGRKLLDPLGLKRHGLVCERHVGVGLSADGIRRRGLPLPLRDMLPLSLEERLICYADKFYSKTDNGRREKAIDDIIAGLIRHDEDYGRRFMILHRFFTQAPPHPSNDAAAPLTSGMKP
ncbi:MAG TPA: phosphohydrolase [Desulfosarcina sp.]|nr:phosphohydrolase [Desulfosarcina sp.]